jgi:site-specific recombinase
MMEHVFERHANEPIPSPQSTAQFIAGLIAEIRPSKPHLVESAINAIHALCHLLDNDPKKATYLRDAILRLLSEHKPISLFLVARHSAFSGFFTEMRRRIGHKLLPEAIDESYLIDLFACFFTKTSDELWVQAIPDEDWAQLIVAMRFNEAADQVVEPCRQNIFAATQVLSYRIAAMGLEPEVLRNHPELEQHTSPFIAQQLELAEFLTLLNINHSSLEHSDTDIKHILVMLNQCSEVIIKIRRNSAVVGTSIQLTLLLQRMAQKIARLETLLEILDYPSQDDNINDKAEDDKDANFQANLRIVQLFKALVYSECHKNDVGEHLRDNMEVMALRVTENASRAGEHYITENRTEYFTLMRSAMGAGILIAIMAMIKITLAKQHMAPLTEAISFSLNYGLGFILIHILHFTVATKQPAMTAAAIAASIDAGSNSKQMDNLVSMIANTMRSQIVAILGNVMLAIPIAILFAFAIRHFTGQHFVTPEKAQLLLADIDPIHSGALLYAAVAGVCLFLSGLIAGYYDNLAIYNKIPQRLLAVTWLQKFLGVARLNRVANYIENNLGALAGNFYFGCLLGGMAAIGVLFGFPFDIRHIAFSSAFVGYAAAGLDFMLSWKAIAYTALYLMLIGFVNLTVSFSLALYVAMKSRKIRFTQWRLLLGSLATRLNQYPGEFIFPPKNLTKK